MSGTAVARQNTGAVQVFELPERQLTLLEQARATIEPYLPRGVDFQAVIADVFLATRKNPDLLKQDAESLVMAVVEVHQRGLRIGSTCHLVPKGGKVHAWNDIRGDVEMIVRSGACRDISPHVVYEHEPFTYAETATGPEMRHEIIDDAATRGPMKGAYARFWLGGSRYMVKYMPLADIEIVRAGSLQWNKTKVPKCPPWYALKTVIRQGAKYLPKNRNLLHVYAAFERDAQLDAALPDHSLTIVRGAGGDAINADTGEIVGSAPASQAAAGPEHGSLEWARAFPLPWRRSDQFGTPIGTFSREHLQSIEAWCNNRIAAAEEQQETLPQSTADLYLATQVLLEELAGQDGDDDADVPSLSAKPAEQLEADVPERERPAPGSQSVRMPKGGKVADALEMTLGDEPKRPSRNAQEI